MKQNHVVELWLIMQLFSCEAKFLVFERFCVYAIDRYSRGRGT